MISKPVFGSSDLVKCLINLDFIQQPQVGSRHLKFSSPRPVPKGQRSFMIILQNKPTYDRITCKNIVKEIKALGFTESEIDEAME